MSIHVVAPGSLTTVQDLGRFGHTHIGVGHAGAMDAVALRLANLLVGNDENAAALEITLRGPILRFDDGALIAITGGEIEAHDENGIVTTWRPFHVRAGCTVDIGHLRSGSRAYLAVRGGLGVEAVLDSRSTDVNTCLGPFGGRALIMGDVVPTMLHSIEHTVHATWSLDPSPWFDERADRPIGLIPGAHFSHLDVQSQQSLFAREFRIGSQSNRVGYRLQGHALRLREPLELVSEGVVPGTVQLPPDGEPIVLMAEAPTTGGYPRIGHIAAVDLPRLAQRRPGQTVRFAEMSPDEAQTRYLQRERELVALRQSIIERLKA
ncbi:MAG TPA: biotin-dependent carboxyltransferase family protein [Rudaea sp.]|jgi:antagonist of KipI|nr:biotin-dependent carboxyltransferase family protein [Rudaea sp.]